MYTLLSISFSEKAAFAVILVVLGIVFFILLVKPKEEEINEIPPYVPKKEEDKPLISEQVENSRKVYEDNLSTREAQTVKPSLTLENPLLEILMTKGKQAGIEFVSNSNENLTVKEVQGIVKACITDNNLKWDLPTKKYVRK